MKSKWFAAFALLSALSLLPCAGKKKAAPLPDAQLLSSFADPSAEWRGKPFWSWNGKLDRDELLRQAACLKEMGFGGYFMHSRVGLDTEYLGEEWFDLVNAVSDEGVRLGMENYLYDEDRWPSGTAGGYVTMDPAFRLHHMTLEILPKDGTLALPDTLVAAFACQLDGTSYTELTRVHSVEEALAAPGNAVLAFHIEEAAPDNFYNGYTYLDAMNRKATDRFIELTHEAYLKHCGRRIGTDIAGIFTDEPHRGMSFSTFGGFGPMKAAWTAELPGLYARRFGSDLIDDLPRLFLHADGAVYDPVKWRWCELTQELFLKHFVKPQSDWCRRHGLAYTGHFLHEDNLTSQVVCQGSLMRAYEYQHIPGIDALTQFNRDYWIAVQVRSVARQTGRRHILSELYGCSGWQMGFENYKEAGDWQTLFGITLRCPHLSWYTMEGEAKRDYPASISFQSAWYRDFKYVEDYYARLGMLLGQGSPVCELLVISPIESVFAQVAVDVFDNLNPASPAMQRIERNYTDLFRWIQGAHVDFDYGDEEMMGRLARVKKTKEGTVLQVGKAAYKAVLVGNMATMRASTLSLLKRFAARGGKVILAGEAPEMLDVVPSAAPRTFLEASAVRVPYTREGVTQAVRSHVRPMASVTGPDGVETEKVFCQTREDGDRTLCVLMNMTGETLPGVRIAFDGAGPLSEWDARSGAVTDLGGQEGPVIRDFSPWQEYVFLHSPRAVGEPLPAPGDVAAETCTVPEEMEYVLSEPNVLPLDFASWKAEGLGEQGPTEVLRIDRAIRSHNGLHLRGDNMLQPWFFHKFYDAGKPSFGAVELRFPFTVECLPAGGLTLCIEEPGDFEISVNGAPLAVAPDGWWVDPCFRKIRLPDGSVRVGENEIVLRTAFTEDRNIEALYLIGDFGVTLDGPKATVTALPERLRVGDIRPQRLPFYSGVVSYKIGPCAASKVRLDAFGGACVRVRKGDRTEMLAFTPYLAPVPGGDGDLWLDVVLTRRNTFGPLHLVPAYPGLIAPAFFVTEGPSWSDAYSLMDAGLTHSPVFE